MKLLPNWLPSLALFCSFLPSLLFSSPPFLPLLLSPSFSWDAVPLCSLGWHWTWVLLSQPPWITIMCHHTQRFSCLLFFFFSLCTCGVWVHMHVWCVGTCECGCTCMWKLKLILGVILNHLFIEVGSLKQNSQIWLVLLASLFRLHLPRLELQMGWLTYTAFLCGFLGIWTFLYGKCFNCWAIFRSIFGFSGFF